MRILQAHNFYAQGAPSGENDVVMEEREILRTRGHTVLTLEASSDAASTVGGQLRALDVQTADLTRSSQHLRDLLRAEAPDVVHFHNLQPYLPPRLAAICTAANIPSVRTIHNFRVSCIAGTHFRGSAECFDCLSRGSGWPGIRHRCYRGSLAQSVVVTANTHWRSQYRDATLLIALTDYMKEFLVGRGFPATRVIVKPNAVRPPQGRTTSETHRAPYLFVGRLDEAKGIMPFLRAWQSVPARPTLNIIGTGPLTDAVATVAHGTTNVNYLGQRSPRTVMQMQAQARAMVVPSRWAEGFPRVIAEAWALGTPVMAHDTAGLRALVGEDKGLVLDTGNPVALSRGIAQLSIASDWHRLSAAAKAFYELWLTSEVSVDRLEEIYSKASALVRGQGRGFRDSQ